MEDKINRIKIDINSSLILALRKMDELNKKLLLVFDKNLFFGLLSIGDIQRAIINNIPLDSKVRHILRKNFLYANVYANEEVIKAEMFKKRIECMPVLDENKELIKVYFWDDFFDEPHKGINEVINIPVVIMAGGKGVRLQPLTNIIPKPLIPIGDITILEKIIANFKHIGCKNFYISVNYKADILEFFIQRFELNDINIECFKENKPLGTIGSLTLIENKINTTFFVSNCDIIVEQDFSEVYQFHKKNNYEITIVGAVKTYSVPYGVLYTGKKGSLKSLSEKPELNFMINTGVYLLEPSVINDIPKNEFFHITDLIEKVRKRKGKVGVFPVSEKAWSDIGDWNEYIKLINVDK